MGWEYLDFSDNLAVPGGRLLVPAGDCWGGCTCWRKNRWGKLDLEPKSHSMINWGLVSIFEIVRFSLFWEVSWGVYVFPPRKRNTLIHPLQCYCWKSQKIWDIDDSTTTSPNNFFLPILVQFRLSKGLKCPAVFVPHMD